MKPITKLRILDFSLWMLFSNGTLHVINYAIDDKFWAMFLLGSCWYLFALIVDGIILKQLYKEL